MALVIIKPFALTLPDGSKRQFAVGEVVEGKLETHWYVKAHAELATVATAAAPVQASVMEEVDAQDNAEAAPEKVAEPLTPSASQTDSPAPMKSKRKRK